MSIKVLYYLFAVPCYTSKYIQVFLGEWWHEVLQETSQIFDERMEEVKKENIEIKMKTEGTHLGSI